VNISCRQIKYAVGWKGRHIGALGLPLGASRLLAYPSAVEIAALIVSVLAVLLTGVGLAWNELRWRSERRTDVRVLAWHDGMGMDIYSADAVETEHLVAVRVFNHGERPEHVMWTGVESLAGEPLVDDRPKAAKLVDEPPPESRELPPRGQMATQFKLPGDALAGGFVGYAMLGAGQLVYSTPATLEQGLEEIYSEVIDAIGEQDPGA
jgi:hypothetical protein